MHCEIDLYDDVDLAVPVERTADLDPEVGDIVEVNVRGMCPVFAGTVDSDGSVTLRVLSISRDNEYVRYLLLVTDGDAERVSATHKVNRTVLEDWDVEKRFEGCDAVVASELCVKKIAKAQRGRFCGKCTEYNEDVRLFPGEEYLCASCRLNPWR